MERSQPGTVSAGRGRVLVVDDDPKIRTLVTAYLEREGFRVAGAADGEEALRGIEETPPDLIVLDLMLPGMDGLTVLRRVRERSDVAVMVLSARGTTADRVLGIHEGADDYLPKPFSPAELVVRANAILRRTAPRRAAAGVLRIADLEIDADRQQVLQGGRPVPLSVLELRLLAAIAGAGGRVLTRDALLDEVYGLDAGAVLDRTIDVHIGRIRDKLGDHAARPRYIATVRGLGYRAAEP